MNLFLHLSLKSRTETHFIHFDTVEFTLPLVTSRFYLISETSPNGYLKIIYLDSFLNASLTSTTATPNIPPSSAPNTIISVRWGLSLFNGI